MSRIDTHAFGLWWKLAKDWFSTKFASIQVDLSPVEDKIDSLDEKITPYLYDECSVEDIDHMFETTTEDGLIIVPSGLITSEGTMPISVFKAITGLTPTE